MEQEIRIGQFLDDAGRIKQLPGKHTKKLAVLEYLTEKFEPGVIYSEQQVNELCNQWYTLGDCFLLRRELVDNGFLNRKSDGTQYWRVWEKDSGNETGIS